MTFRPTHMLTIPVMNTGRGLEDADGHIHDALAGTLTGTLVPIERDPLVDALVLCEAQAIGLDDVDADELTHRAVRSWRALDEALRRAGTHPEPQGGRETEEMLAWARALPRDHGARAIAARPWNAPDGEQPDYRALSREDRLRVSGDFLRGVAWTDAPRVSAWRVDWAAVAAVLAPADEPETETRTETRTYNLTPCAHCGRPVAILLESSARWSGCNRCDMSEHPLGLCEVCHRRSAHRGLETHHHDGA